MKTWMIFSFFQLKAVKKFYVCWRQELSKMSLKLKAEGATYENSDFQLITDGKEKKSNSFQIIVNIITW